MTLDLAKAWLQSTETYQAFDKARRESVRAKLHEAVRESVEITRGASAMTGEAASQIVDRVTDRHLDAVAAAGLPVMKILKLVGAAQLMKLAAMWKASSDDKTEEKA